MANTGYISLSFSAPAVHDIAGKFDNVPVALAQGIANSAYYMKEMMQDYPVQSGHSRMDIYGFSFFSDKQRKWVFANKAFHYARTNTLAANWVATPSALVARISNKTPYGPYVQDEFGQTLYHRPTWPTTAQMLFQATPGIMEFMKEAIQAGLF